MTGECSRHAILPLLTDTHMMHICSAMPMKRQMIQLTDRQVVYLAKEARRLGITVSDLIRRILDERMECSERSTREGK